MWHWIGYPYNMFSHNLLQILRNFKRSKSSFFINLFGLTLGMSSALLIYLWIADELRVDNFFENDERIFQVMQNTTGETGIQTMEATPGLLSKTMSAELPEVELAVSVVPPSFNVSKGTISVGDNRIKSSGQYVSADFLNIFSYTLLAGNRAQALSDKKNIVISDRLAIKLFKSISGAVGQTIEWNSQEIKALCIVSGVVQSPPSNATNQFDFLLKFELFEEGNPSDSWGNNSPYTYVLLRKSISEKQLNAKITDFIKLHDANSNATLFIQRYSDRYLHGQYENGEPAGGRSAYLKLFSIIGIFVLVIACINFMNLSTAKSLDKMKAVGIKKTLGASRKTLVVQHLSESMVMSFISLALAILVNDLSMGTFNNITGKHLHLTFDHNLIIVMLGLTVFTGLFSGSYPAFYLSSSNAAKLLKGKLSPSIGELSVRRGLIVFQFAIAVILITGVAVVYQQMKFIQGKNLGFNRDQVLYFNCSGMTNTVMAEIKSIPGVLDAGGGRLLTGNRLGGTNDLQWEGKVAEDDVFMTNLWMSFGLIETLDMKMVEGHPFRDNPNSRGEIIFNEQAIQRMQLKNPVGKKIKIGGEDKEIIGVVKDFHFESLYEAVKPCALLIAPIEYAPHISVKIQEGKEQSTISQLQKLWKQRYPAEPFEFRFMDDDYQKLYAAESRVSTLAKYFAFIAILISTMGLFGLATFIAQRRTKEIGIRKVLGSSVIGIVYLLSADFTKAVLLAISIAIPVSYLAARYWLDNFAFKISLEWWFFVGAGFLVLVIAWLTVGTQAIKSATVNPTDCLKND
jgi:putative ABC transport system permease protein